MPGTMQLRIWDVEHGACAMLSNVQNGLSGRLAMIDCGHKQGWRPSIHIRYGLQRTTLDYLIITNADQDHVSDLQGLWDYGVAVTALWRNRHPQPDVLRQIKEAGGTLTAGMERYLQIHSSYTGPVAEPFDVHMGGITLRTYFNPYPQFTTTNDLSLVAVIQYGSFRIMFPGDLEKAGWLALLQNQAFHEELARVDVLVASHHGRENGYCPEVFEHCRPLAVVMSDKPIVHETQNMTQTYRNHVTNWHPDGVLVRTTGKRRRVLTTRRDGWIEFTVDPQGAFYIDTECKG